MWPQWMVVVELEAAMATQFILLGRKDANAYLSIELNEHVRFCFDQCMVAHTFINCHQLRAQVKKK